VHGGKGFFEWMIVSFPHCIHVASKKKHGNVGGKSAFQEQKTKLGAPCFAMLLARCNLDAMGKTCNQDPPLSIHPKKTPGMFSL
jgi:hypothetical protein